MEKISEKIKIIALTGPIGVDLEIVREFLTMNKKVLPLERKIAGGETLSVDEFLNKMANGTIIEASCNDDNLLVWGTDISDLSSEYLYIGIYTPEQIDILEESSSIELLPLEISMSERNRLDYILSNKYGDIIETLKRFIDEEKHYDAKEYLNESSMGIYYKDSDELYNECYFHILEHKIKDFNKINNFITDLDKFI